MADSAVTPHVFLDTEVFRRTSSTSNRQTSADSFDWR